MAVEIYSDEELKEALIKHNGQPTKAATELKVSYISVYGRIRKNPELIEVQKSSRQKTFQDLSNFQVSAVLGGIMKVPAFDEEGAPQKDDAGNQIYKDASVGVAQRLEYSSRLMGLFKSDEGIKETVVVESGGIDLSGLSDGALAELMRAVDHNKPEAEVFEQEEIPESPEED